MGNLGIIADDLTGACDTGVQFVIRGFSTVVWLDSEDIDDTPVDVTVVTTNSRGDSPDTARQKVWQACQQLIQRQTTVVYKKIDSTLKGNIGAEIEAVMESCGYPLAIITPAFPEMGRSLAGGWLQVSGNPLNDPLHLPGLLRRQSTLRVAHLGQPSLLGGLAPLLDELRLIHDEGYGIVVIDAISAEDLSIIARAAMEFTPAPLMVGSAGLAAHVAMTLAQKRQSLSCTDKRINVTEEDSPVGPVVIFVGSRNPVTAAQVKRLMAGGETDIIQPGQDRADAARKTLRERRHLIVPISWRDNEELRHVREFLSLLEEYTVRGLVLSGGDTARLVCRAMGVRGIRLEREIVTGLPSGRLIGGAFNGLAVCTKAGGFGNEDAIVVVVNALAR